MPERNRVAGARWLSTNSATGRSAGNVTLKFGSKFRQEHDSAADALDRGDLVGHLAIVGAEFGVGFFKKITPKNLRRFAFRRKSGAIHAAGDNPIGIHAL